MSVSDHNSAFLHPSQNRIGGAMAILSSGLSLLYNSYNTQRKKYSKSLFGLRRLTHDLAVYADNVNAPVRAEKRVLLFALLLFRTLKLAATFSYLAIFNTSLDPARNTSSRAIRHESRRLACLEVAFAVKCGERFANSKSVSKIKDIAKHEAIRLQLHDRSTTQYRLHGLNISGCDMHEII